MIRWVSSILKILEMVRIQPHLNWKNLAFIQNMSNHQVFVENRGIIVFCNRANNRDRVFTQIIQGSATINGGRRVDCSGGAHLFVFEMNNVVFILFYNPYSWCQENDFKPGNNSIADVAIPKLPCSTSVFTLRGIFELYSFLLIGYLHWHGSKFQWIYCCFDQASPE